MASADSWICTENPSCSESIMVGQARGAMENWPSTLLSFCDGDPEGIQLAFIYAFRWLDDAAPYTLQRRRSGGTVLYLLSLEPGRADGDSTASPCQPHVCWWCSMMNIIEGCALSLIAAH